MRAVSSFALMLFAAPVAAAQPAPPSPTVFGETHFVGETPVDVVVRWRMAERRIQPQGTVEVRVGERATRVHEGGPAYAWAAANERGVLVALVGASASVEVAFVPVVEGRPGSPRAGSVTRLAGADRAPIGAAVAARPDGFAVFWQEASTSNPSATYQTFVALFDPEGRPRGGSQAVQAPWPIADVAWLPERGQYYFLVYYGGADPRGTRLCGVHVDGQAQRNLEHPWWASRPGMIDEARLVVGPGDRVIALYRDGGRLFEIDVSEGSWGRDPRVHARPHGDLAPDASWGARRRAGAIEVLRSPLSRSDDRRDD